MARGRGRLDVKPVKTHLPSKLCKTCGRVFVWRKKWRRVWDAVLYCSERCRQER
jgi:hypothetical protein